MRTLLPALLVVLVGCSGNGPNDGAKPDLAKSTLTVDPVMGAVANNMTDVHLTVVVHDANDKPLSQVAVTFAVTGSNNSFGEMATTDQQGQAIGTLHSSKAEKKTVTASIVIAGVPTPLPSVDVTFVAGPPESLRFAVQPTTTRAGVVMTPAVVIEMLDSNMNPTTSGSASASVRLVRSNGGTVSGGAAKASVDGRIVFDNLVINRPQTGYALRAEMASGAADESVMFDVTVGTLSMATSTFDPMPVNVLADGTASTTLTLTARDTGGNVLGNQAVTVTASGTGNTLGASTGMTDVGGVFTTTLKSTVPETKTVTATIGTVSLMTTVTFYP